MRNEKFCYLISRLSFLTSKWHIAVGEEGVRHYFAGLPPGCVVVGTEVWQVVGWYTWLTCAAAWIAAHYSTRSKTLDEIVEGRANRHMLEGLCSMSLRKPGSVRDYLGYLATSG